MRICQKELILERVVLDAAYDILRIRQDINAITDRLSEILFIEDEIERESAINLLLQSFFELGVYIKISPNMAGAICLIHTCVKANIREVYTRHQIVALRKALIKMRDNVFMDVETLDECHDILEEAGFDTRGTERI